MRKNKRFPVLIVVVSILLIIVAWLFIPNRLHWARSYNPDDKNPYGTFVLYNLLQKTRGYQPFVMLKDSIDNRLPEDPGSFVDNYIYIGFEYYADSSEVDRLLKFVAAGNQAFLFCENQYNLVFDSLTRMPISSYDVVTEFEEFGDGLITEEIVPEKVYAVEDSAIAVSLDPDKRNEYKLSRKYDHKIIPASWSYFHDSLVMYGGEQCDPLGSFDEGYTNYIRCPYGKGYIYFHSTPLVFTNYAMMSDTAMNYCRDALSFLGPGVVYWDEDNRNYKPGKLNHHSSGNASAAPSEGPLEFILSEPSLRAAWYTLLVGALLYIFFGAKRRQRIIEAAEKTENTSIEYAGVLSQMFMKQLDHKKLVLMKMELFRSFLRDRFFLKLPLHMKDEDENLYKEISLKSNVDNELVRNIFEQHKYLSSISSVDTPEMLEFHNRLEKFYHTCK